MYGKVTSIMLDSLTSKQPTDEDQVGVCVCVNSS